MYSWKIHPTILAAAPGEVSRELRQRQRNKGDSQRDPSNSLRPAGTPTK